MFRASRVSRDRRSILAASVAVAALIGGQVHAAIDQSGDYSPDPATWTTTTDAVVGDTGTGSVGFTDVGGYNVATLVIGRQSSGNGTVNYSGTTIPANGTGVLTVGAAGTGTLNVSADATLTSNNITVGEQAGSNGTISVSGTGTTWRTSAPVGVTPIVYVGKSGTGTLSISNHATVTNNQTVYIGYQDNAVGTVNVSGTNAEAGGGIPEGWSTGLMYVGANGNSRGTLNITAGGDVSSNDTSIGQTAGASGSVLVDGAGSTWKSNTITVGSLGTGSLTITNGGSVTAYRLESGYSGTGVGSILVDGEGSTLSVKTTVNSTLRVGGKNVATMIVRNKGTVESQSTIIGAGNGKTAVMRVIGTGSAGSDTTLNNVALLSIGSGGAGSLYVTQGARVTAATVTVGNSSNAPGLLRIDGERSSVASADSLYVGQNSQGRMVMSNGASASAANVTNFANGLIAMDIGKGTTLTINNGTGTLTNNGMLRLTAAANTAPGVYTPIVAGSVTSGGTQKAFGGQWNSALRTFTVSAAATGNAGSDIAFVITNTKSAYITDTGTGRHLGVSFDGTMQSTSPAHISAQLFDSSEIDTLNLALATDETYLSGWDISFTVGALHTAPAYLSVEVGSGFDVDALRVWHYDGAAWSLYAPDDLSYDGTFASFTVAGFSGYAITSTAPVPEPASLAVVGLAATTLLLRRRR